METINRPPDTFSAVDPQFGFCAVKPSQFFLLVCKKRSRWPDHKYDCQHGQRRETYQYGHTSISMDTLLSAWTCLPAFVKRWIVALWT